MTQMLKPYYNNNNNIEIGIDEAGRGPLFGRLYVAAVVLPKGPEFQHCDMKDSKKFHSKKKIKDIAEYIKSNAISWSVQYVEPEVIDEINIRQAVFKGMHECIRDILYKMNITDINNNLFLLIDGNDFRPFTLYNENTEEIETIPYETIEKGDNKYTAIAAASILAKVHHDEYISKLCSNYPELIEKYGLDKNVGYGTKQHITGIELNGITQWHRKSFARCSNALLSPITEKQI